MPKRYAFQEAINRLAKLMRGENLTDDTPERYSGGKSWDESLSDIAELAQNSFPGISGTIPYGLCLQNSHLDSGAHVKVHQDGIGYQRIGTDDNYTEFDDSGTMKFRGAATVFDDISSELNTTRQGALGKPDYDYDNLGLLFPNDDASEIIHLIIQFKHSKRLDTAIYPHIHYIQSVTGTPIFEYYYRWYNNGEHAPSVWFTGSTVDGNRAIFEYSSGSMMQIASFPAVSPPMVNEDVSSNFEMKLWRNDAIVAGDVLTKYIDIHYEIDTAGSDAQYSK